MASSSLYETKAAPMPLPGIDVARVHRWVDARNEETGKHIHEMRVEVDIDARAVTILECRPPWRDDLGTEWIRQEIARLRYTKATGTWRLYWPDRNSRFHAYEGLQPTRNIERLLEEVDRDPTCIFWG